MRVPVGFRRLTEMVGRQDVVRDLEQALETVQDQRGVQVVFLMGKGGYGKTYLLEQMLRKWRDKYAYVLLPDRVVDLYDVVTHTVEGFVEQLMAAFDSAWEDPMLAPHYRRYQDVRARLARARLQGDAARIRDARQAYQNQVKSIFREISRTLPLVWMLDTAERWVYRTGPGEDDVTLAEAWNCLWKWLQDETQRPESLLLIIAGRPQRTRALQRAVREKRDFCCERDILLRPFTVEEVEAYLRQVEIELEVEGLARDAARIHRLTQGSPIRLGVFVDMYLRRPQEAEALLESGRPADMLESLFNMAPWSELLRYLGAAARGLSPGLLAYLEKPGTDLPSEEEIQRARRKLEAARNMVFIKVRPLYGEDHFFLHDEVYDWVRELLFREEVHRTERGPERSESTRLERLLAAAADFVVKHRLEREIWGKLRNLYARIAEGGHGHGEEVQNAAALWEQQTRLEAWRRQAYADVVYYRLRSKPSAGMRRVLRMLWEARSLKRDDIVRALFVELSEYWHDLIEEEGKDRPWFPLPTEEKRYYITGLMKLRPLWEAATLRRRLEGVLEQVRGDLEQWMETALPRLEEKHAQTLRVILESLLDLAASDEKIRDGKLDEVLQTLRNALNRVHALRGSSEDPFLRWWRYFLEGVINRVMGYAYAREKAWSVAIERYTEAFNLLRNAVFYLEEAIAANDGAFALAHVGAFERAERFVLYALSLRLKMGLGLFYGLSLNTRARINLLQGSFWDAVQDSTAALRVFQAVEYRRGEGLAHLALAEAYRRLGNQEFRSLEQRREFLQNAQEHAQKALDIFTHEVDEVLRRLEAYDQLARALRQLYRLSRDADQPDERLKRKALRTFQVVRRMAQEMKLPVYEVQALVGEMWLRFHTGEGVASLLKEIHRIIVERCPQAQDVPEWVKALQEGRVYGGICSSLAGEYGRALVVAALYALDHGLTAGAEKNSEWLQKAARSALLGLEILQRAPGQHYVRWQAEEHLDKRLRRMNPGELRVFITVFCEVAQELGLAFEETRLYKLLVEGGLWGNGHCW